MMRRRITCVACFLLLISLQTGFSQDIYHSEYETFVLKKGLQDQELLAYYLASDPRSSKEDLEKYSKKLTDFVHRAKKRRTRYKSEKKFLESTFYKVHRKYLHRYKEYTTFYSLLNEKDYDCLSATTLYAFILNELNFDFEVVETNYHIYILVDINGEEVLLETTNPLNGFISDSKVIAGLKQEYRTGGSKDETLHDFEFTLENKVTQEQLIGLLYYNQAVKYINFLEIGWALNSYQKAKAFYHSERLEAFKNLINDHKLLSAISNQYKED